MDVASEIVADLQQQLLEVEEETTQPHSSNRSGSNNRRNAPIIAPFKSIDTQYYKDSKIRLRPGNFVQLSDGYFMHIKTIVRDTRSQEVTLRGYIASKTPKSDDKHLLAGKQAIGCCE